MIQPRFSTQVIISLTPLTTAVSLSVFFRNYSTSYFHVVAFIIYVFLSVNFVRNLLVQTVIPWVKEQEHKYQHQIQIPENGEKVTRNFFVVLPSLAVISRGALIDVTVNHSVFVGIGLLYGLCEFFHLFPRVITATGRIGSMSDRWDYALQSIQLFAMYLFTKFCSHIPTRAMALANRGQLPKQAKSIIIRMSIIFPAVLFLMCAMFRWRANALMVAQAGGESAAMSKAALVEDADQNEAPDVAVTRWILTRILPNAIQKRMSHDYFSVFTALAGCDYLILMFENAVVMAQAVLFNRLFHAVTDKYSAAYKQILEDSQIALNFWMWPVGKAVILVLMMWQRTLKHRWATYMFLCAISQAILVSLLHVVILLARRQEANPTKRLRDCTPENPHYNGAAMESLLSIKSIESNEEAKPSPKRTILGRLGAAAGYVGRTAAWALLSTNRGNSDDECDDVLVDDVAGAGSVPAVAQERVLTREGNVLRSYILESLLWKCRVCCTEMIRALNTKSSMIGIIFIDRVFEDHHLFGLQLFHSFENHELVIMLKKTYKQIIWYIPSSLLSKRVAESGEKKKHRLSKAWKYFWRRNQYKGIAVIAAAIVVVLSILLASDGIEKFFSSLSVMQLTGIGVFVLIALCFAALWGSLDENH